MKLTLLVGLPFLITSLCSAQTCAVSVTAQGVTVGSGQTTAVRTANTSALNTMFAHIGTGAIACHNVQFPEGTIEINGAVTVTVGPITIAGVNRETSIVMQTVATAPVFLWNSNNAYTTGIFVHDLGISNLNTTAPYNTAQWGMQFQCTANGQGGNSFGYANNQFERLSISNMNVGLGIYTASGGVCGFWATHFQDIKFYNNQNHAIYLASSGSIGQPALQFDRIDILQENSPPATTGEAVYIVSAGGLLLNSIDIEGWDNNELAIFGGNSTIINNLRVEHAVFNGCNPSIAFFDGDVTMNGTSISWDTLNNTCIANVFSVEGASSSLNVSGVTLSSTVAPSAAGLTMWRVEVPSPPSKIIAKNLTLNSLASEYVPSTNGALTTTLYSRYTIDDLPPPVDVLPAASAVYAGRSFAVVGTNSRIVYQCIQNTAGTWVWQAQ